ncbi:MAG TPA: ANTAR domain-containing protein [Mycobacteriales bacterium]|nr:ANTAR domain-containing protein [Mycobacteriales bacterium]
MSPSGVPPTAVGDVVIRRTPDGWVVRDTEQNESPAEDLTCAMVLADLLANDLVPRPRPAKPDHALGEIDQLKLAVRQLEHALTARVIIEQAIGVVAERRRIGPRDAFERLRRVARSRGRKVHDLAREVVASVTDRAVPLPPELAPPHR